MQLRSRTDCVINSTRTLSTNAAELYNFRVSQPKLPADFRWITFVVSVEFEPRILRVLIGNESYFSDTVRHIRDVIRCRFFFSWIFVKAYKFAHVFACTNIGRMKFRIRVRGEFQQFFLRMFSGKKGGKLPRREILHTVYIRNFHAKRETE